MKKLCHYYSAIVEYILMKTRCSLSQRFRRITWKIPFHFDIGLLKNRKIPMNLESKQVSFSTATRRRRLSLVFGGPHSCNAIVYKLIKTRRT